MGKTHKNAGKYDARDTKNDKSQFKNSKKFKKRDTSDAQLIELLKQDGYEIHYMLGDGNCLFRSVAHQLTGEPSMHPDFRTKVMRYIKKNKDHFSLFLEDDEKFADYVERMEVIGEWGGHLELYALTQCCNVTIVIHQLDSPNYKLPAADPTSKIEIHLSYHGECHYNSVKRFNDLSMGVSDWVMADVDELGSSTAQQSSSYSNGRKKALSVAAVATVSTRNGPKKKGVKVAPSSAISVSTGQSVSSDIVTYETVKEDYVLVTIDHDSSPTAPPASTEEVDQLEQAVPASSDPLSVLSSGFEMVCNALGSLTMGAAAPTTAQEDTSTECTTSVSTSDEVIITTRNGRPMSKKERRQYEKQMSLNKNKPGGGNGLCVKEAEAPDSNESSTKKEIIL